MSEPEVTRADLMRLDRALTPHERRYLFNTRTAGNGGYADAPGSGPAGHRCGDCAHYARRQGGVRHYRKCKLMEAIWTHGPGTDIKAKSPACSKWEPIP